MIRRSPIATHKKKETGRGYRFGSGKELGKRGQDRHGSGPTACSSWRRPGSLGDRGGSDVVSDGFLRSSEGERRAVADSGTDRGQSKGQKGTGDRGQAAAGLVCSRILRGAGPAGGRGGSARLMAPGNCNTGIAVSIISSKGRSPS